MKMWMDRRTKNGQMNGRNYTNFERNLAMMVMYVPARSLETKMWTDRQTDVGHINVIGALVTCNPPKNTLLHKED